MHDRDRHRPLDRPAERVALYLRAIREFRRLARTAIRGGPTASPAGLAGTFQILRAVHRLRYISADHPGADADGAGFIVMLDPVTPHSKASQIVASLKAHGMPPERIFAPRRVGLLGRLRLQLAAGFVVLKVRPWRRRLQVPELTLVIAALVHARRLARGRSTTVHIGDRSPRRIAFAVGARLAGRRSLYWQNGFHDQATPDLGYTDAAILNAAGEAVFAGRETTVWALDPPASFALRLPDQIARLGVATNAYAGAEIETMRDTVSALFSDAQIALRLHPRIETFDAARVPDWDVRPRGEALDVFARSCDAVICGSTAAQIEILLAGTPVIHLAGLDPHGFDFYGYVARGISYGFTVPPPGRIEDALAAFYQAPGWSDRMQTEVTGPSDETPSLRAYLRALVQDAER